MSQGLRQGGKSDNANKMQCKTILFSLWYQPCLRQANEKLILDVLLSHNGPTLLTQFEVVCPLRSAVWKELLFCLLKSCCCVHSPVYLKSCLFFITKYAQSVEPKMPGYISVS